MPTIAELLTDLDAESADLDAVISGRPGDDWMRDTPAAGWTVAHQIAHLSWTDHMACLSATDPDAFVAELTRAVSDPEHFVDRAAEAWLAPPAEMRERWRAGRARLVGALTAADPKSRLPWYGMGMSPSSMATGRIMETWAHGQDVADALGVTRMPTARLRHVAHLATRTVGFSFEAHGRDDPGRPVRLELLAPDGTVWIYGPHDAGDVVTGSALDFCLVATHRRHRDDVRLTAVGEVADAWLDVVQTFAGPPGQPRAKLSGAG
jgi:uncharacterized protein (TIGR03084 family)